VAAVFLVLHRDTVAVSAQLSARTRRHGQLVVVAAEDATVPVGTAYTLLPFTTLGRAPANTVHLPDTFASNYHALISLRNGQWWLEDQDSRNGTLLNGQRLESPTVVSAGDMIGVGRVELKLELD
jgi:hypothetical protein